MKTFFPGPLADHARNLMRSLGYGEQRTKQGQISYIKRLGGDRFPHYHAYVEDVNGGMQVNLHLDQKEASYSGTSMHAGEYEGPAVEEEMRRIAYFLKGQSSGSSAPSAQPVAPTSRPAPVSKFFQ